MTSRGILYPAKLPSFTRIDAPESIADLVRWFWIPEWDIEPGRTSRQHLIAFPACNLAVEPDLVGLAGPTTRASYRDLSGRGWTVGALLQPAAVPLLSSDPKADRDRYRIIDAPELHQAVASIMNSGSAESRHAAAVAAFTDWLVDLGSASEQGLLANRMAALIEDDQITRVEDLANRMHLSERSLQRLAQVHVGLSPKTMIQRRRLQVAAELVRTQPDVSLAQLATELGYVDQAHLTNDFSTVLGFTPSQHRSRGGIPGGP